MREVGALPPLANARAGGSTDAALLEIEEVLGMRYCDPSQMTAVALRNPVDEDDERLEYLVSGRFGSGPDDCGFHSVAWVFHGDAGPCRCGYGQVSDTRVQGPAG